MADIDIDRLALDVPGLRAEDGPRLATLVAQGLGAPGLRSSPFAAERLRVNLSSGVRASTLDHLAREIVAAIRREMGE